MTEKKNKKTTVLDDIILPTVRLGTEGRTVNISESLIGKDVTLNQKMDSFIGVGPIWLTPTNYTTRIPSNLNEQDYIAINKLIQNGTLVFGDHLIPPVDKASTIPEEYWQKMKGARKLENIKREFINLYRKGSDRGWTAFEIYEYCYKQESKTKKREDMLKLLVEVLNNYDGPLTLYVPPDKPEDIHKVIIDKDTNQITKIKADGTREVLDNGSANKKTELPNLSPEASALLSKLLSSR